MKFLLMKRRLGAARGEKGLEKNMRLIPKAIIPHMEGQGFDRLMS